MTTSGSTPTSATCPVYLITYDRGKDYKGATKPYHWEFFFETGPPGSGTGITHQLHGMPGAFYYSGSEPATAIWSSANGALIKESLEIGSIPREVVEGSGLEEILKAIPIEKDEVSEWNCQSWGGEAIARMMEKGWVDAQYSFAVVKEWMKEQ